MSNANLSSRSSGDPVPSRDTTTILPPQPAASTARPQVEHSGLPPAATRALLRGRVADSPTSTQPQLVEQNTTRARRWGPLLSLLVIALFVSAIAFTNAAWRPEGKVTTLPVTHVSALSVISVPSVLIATHQSPGPKPAATQGKLQAPKQDEMSVSSGAFDFAGAMAQIDHAALAASSCGLDAPTYAGVTVTFAPSGKVTRALVDSGPLQSTEAGSCLARRLRDLRVDPFIGQRATLKTALVVPTP